MDELTREELVAIILELRAEAKILNARVLELERENAELRGKLGGGGSAPAKPEWVKVNRGQRTTAERKKRKEAFARRRETPTEVVYHAVERCPDCGRKLSGGWVHDRRQVIEIPRTPVQIIEHVLVARRCGACGKRHIPKLELSGQVVGKCRFGIRLMSLVTSLAIAYRMPYRSIQKILASIYRVKISAGQISEIVQKVSGLGEREYSGLLEDVRASPVVHADETGWREDGINGYIWSFSTPSVRYFLYDQSRGSRVVEEVLGDEFAGVLVSDFYSGYNIYDGVKQRCWVHFLRDLHELVDKHPKNESLKCWCESIKSVYEEAKQVARGDLSQTERCRLRQGFESKLLELAEPYLERRDPPQHVLAKRIDRFLGEMFTFVDSPEVPPENNAAERAVRPAVIARKVSGGTRSARGSKAKMTLMSLFGTWQLRKQNPLDACIEMLVAAQG